MVLLWSELVRRSNWEPNWQCWPFPDSSRKKLACEKTRKLAHRSGANAAVLKLLLLRELGSLDELVQDFGALGALRLVRHLDSFVVAARSCPRVLLSQDGRWMGELKSKVIVGGSCLELGRISSRRDWTGGLAPE